MGARESRFLEKKGINPSLIMYMTRDGRKTILHLENGEKYETFHAIKGILEELPRGLFECINKGIVVSSRYVSSVLNNTYTMTDGTVFHGRVRATSVQKENVIKYNKQEEFDVTKQYAILDTLPFAFCVIEVVFDELSHGIDFIFRYCNHEMEVIEGKSIDEMLNKSFYDVFKNGDKKWLVTYADVAINGTQRIIEEYSPEIDANLKVYCFQPKPNYCACILIKV